ncbi:NACHT domain-containing protein [Roseomonas harenae]|uniref:hypothetical protein n=1 Tax=Muricoccus harenae TaxID=2692566 RepID=UPI0013316551|nr:hypothetical protein [Roseomonas harenae]
MAALEKSPDGSRFFRKGPGGDAGVECYRAEPDGTEVGWQAKFFDEFSTSQIQQLDKSITNALERHQRLKRYVVCLPVDLSDSRVGKSQTQLKRWQEWVQKWSTARGGGKKPLLIELWGASQLTDRLTRDDPHHAGRRLYWFDETVLSPDWFGRQFARAAADLGARYSPETDVNLPIRSKLLAFARDPLVAREAAALADRLDEKGQAAANAMTRLGCVTESAVPVDILALARPILADLERIVGARPADPLPWQDVSRGAAAMAAAIRTLHDWISRVAPGVKKGSISDPASSARSELFRISDAVDDLKEVADGPLMRLTNTASVVLCGEAGAGKSHLLADMVADQLRSGSPALLLLGNRFSGDEPWTWLQQRLGLGHLARDTVLGALDAAAEATGRRALILVDGINERPGLTHWRDTVAGFLQTARSYQHIGIVLSCRTTYLPYFEESLPEDRIPRVEHVGFAGTDGQAAAAYLAGRGIVRPGAPYFSPEFNNPLFLKSCCDLLDREGSKVMPRGLRGITQVLDFYLRAVTASIERRLDLSPRLKLPRKALEALTLEVVARGNNSVPFVDAHAITEGVRSSNGRADEDLLTLFENEGLITVEPSGPDEDASDHVRFTFERLTDHLGARRLLDEHLTEDPAASFAPNTPLGSIIRGDDAFALSGLIEALAVQVPEQAGRELPDLVEGLPLGHPCWRGFRRSLLWR